MGRNLIIRANFRCVDVRLLRESLFFDKKGRYKRMYKKNFRMKFVTKDLIVMKKKILIKNLIMTILKLEWN